MILKYFSKNCYISALLYTPHDDLPMGLCFFYFFPRIQQLQLHTFFNCFIFEEVFKDQHSGWVHQHWEKPSAGSPCVITFVITWFGFCPALSATASAQKLVIDVNHQSQQHGQVSPPSTSLLTRLQAISTVQRMK